MSKLAHVYNGNAIVPQDRVGHDECVVATGPSPRRFVSIWASRMFMVLVLTAGGLALTDFASDVDKRDQNLADAGQPEPGGGERFVSASGEAFGMPTVAVGSTAPGTLTSSMRSTS